MIGDSMQGSINRLIRLSVREIPKTDICPSILGSDNDDDDNNVQALITFLSLVISKVDTNYM